MKKRPNIIIFNPDEMRYDAMSHMGNPAAETPFLDEFAEALSAADAVVLADIYAARETDTLGISSADIASRIEKLGSEVHYFPSFEEIEAFLLKNCSTGDLLITMGAGDIVKVGEKLLGK